MNHSEERILFEERQFMGQNRMSVIIRSIFALFCFLGYYWSENPKPIQFSIFRIGSYPIENISLSGAIFFVTGSLILLLSAGFTFVLHTHTKIYMDHIIIDGFWTTRKVKIDLSQITSLRKGKYKRNIFRRAVYNLHNKGIIRFYTSGDFFIELHDKAGFTYRIGTQRPVEFLRILNSIKG